MEASPFPRRNRRPGSCRAETPHAFPPPPSERPSRNSTARRKAWRNRLNARLGNVVKPALTILSEFPPALKFAEIHWYKNVQYQGLGRMDFADADVRPARFALVRTSVFGFTGLAGCSLSPFGGHSKPETTAAVPAPPRPAEPVARQWHPTAGDPRRPPPQRPPPLRRRVRPRRRMPARSTSAAISGRTIARKCAS